ncbi:hypothetical protein LCGC14_3060120, partial [marine sediment metagenome]
PLPYCCDAQFMFTWDIRKTFDVPKEIIIKADAELTLLGTERETTRGGKPLRGDTGRNLPANYSRIPEGSGGQPKHLKDKALVVEIWIKDNSTTAEDVMGDGTQAEFEEGPGGMQFEVFEGGQRKMEQVVVDQRQVPVYPDGIRKVTIAPGMMDQPNKGILDDGRNPNINWELLNQRVQGLMETGIPVPAIDENTGQPLLDDQGLPVPELQPVDEEQATKIVYDLTKPDFLWGRFPFSAVTSLIDTSQWWGFSIYEQLEAMQGKSEDMLTKYIAYLDRALFPILMLPEGCGVPNSKISNAPGIVIRPILSFAPFIRYVEPPRPPDGYLEMVQYLQLQHDIVGGTPEVTTDRAPK